RSINCVTTVNASPKSSSPIRFDKEPKKRLEIFPRRHEEYRYTLEHVAFAKGTLLLGHRVYPLCQLFIFLAV
ncbi:hypothetical protein, partial [Ligilactobacillus aviarius]|uniref:hypothetical protein n=1 Tax=Ligilactobacillus aviarius TaxID=1606 RepID=UPI0024BB5518